MSRFAMSMLSRTITVRDDAARREPGYEPVITFDEGLRALSADA